MISLFVFLIGFFFITNWFQILTILSAVFGGKVENRSIKDKWIYETIYKKTGLKLLDITIYKDKRMYGMMAGIPLWSKMILSEGLYNNLNKDELEWVILHEAGHCVLWHNLKAAIYQLIFVVFGVCLIYTYNLNFIISLLLAVVFSLICIQVIRRLIEYEADKFSIVRVDNPKGVITAQEKFRKSKNKNLFSSEKSLGRFLLYWNIYPSKRIEMAKARLSSQQSSE